MKITLNVTSDSHNSYISEHNILEITRDRQFIVLHLTAPDRTIKVNADLLKLAIETLSGTE